MKILAAFLSIAFVAALTASADDVVNKPALTLDGDKVLRAGANILRGVAGAGVFGPERGRVGGDVEVGLAGAAADDALGAHAGQLSNGHGLGRKFRRGNPRLLPRQSAVQPDAELMDDLDRAIDMTARLVSFDTESDKSNLPLIDFVESYLRKEGVPFARAPNAVGDKAAIMATAKIAK